VVHWFEFRREPFQKGVTSLPEPVKDDEETRVAPSCGCCSPAAMALASNRPERGEAAAAAAICRVDSSRGLWRQ